MLGGGDPPHVTSPVWGPQPPCKQALKTAFDSTPWISDQSLSSELGFRIPVVSRIPESLSCISGFQSPDFSPFHKQKFPNSGMRISLHGVINTSPSLIDGAGEQGLQPWSTHHGTL